MGTAFKILPKNYFSDWGEFESWAAGAASAPDGWISASSPFGLAQESTIKKFGDFSARVIGSTGGVSGIYRTVPSTAFEDSNFHGKTFKFGIWARSASTGPYFEINDGVNFNTVHLDGSNAFVFLTTPSVQVDYNATQIRINLFASANATAYFDGAVLCEGEDLFTEFNNNIAISDWQPSLNMKQDQYEVSGRAGSFIPETHTQGRPLRLRGSVVGTDAASTRTHFDQLMKAVVGWKENEKRSLYLYDDRVIDVFFSGSDWRYRNSMKWIDFNLSFNSAESATRSINKYRTRTVIAATITDFTLQYDGNFESKPVISFIANQGAAITTCQLENLTTAESIIYSGTVPTGVALDIDCDAGTVFNSSVNRIQDFGTSEFMRLVRGTNKFRFTGSNCQINIDAYDKNL